MVCNLWLRCCTKDYSYSENDGSYNVYNAWNHARVSKQDSIRAQSLKQMHANFFLKKKKNQGFRDFDSARARLYSLEREGLNLKWQLDRDMTCASFNGSDHASIHDTSLFRWYEGSLLHKRRTINVLASYWLIVSLRFSFLFHFIFGVQVLSIITIIASQGFVRLAE